MATHNSGKYLEGCLKSIFKQSFKNYEIIIIDNQSKDKTLKIIKKYEKKIGFWLSEKDKGIFDAMNKGIKNSKGKIISILNSDDVFYPNALKIINKYFISDNKIDYVFGTVLKKKIYSGFRPELIRWRFNIYPSHSVGFFIKKKVHNKIGLYNTKYRHSNDYDFFYRLIKKNIFFGVRTSRTEVLGKFRDGGFSSTLGFFDRLMMELKIRLDNKQSIFDLLLIFFGRCVFKVINIFK
ncbi:glycosyltransferase [Candidatus Pelagibacter sp. Uisw_134_02]|uniref:glycosyltransferase n=1 Tax=Candidatus Pelagibacter sp. Uisw_134_02 TaxID=3230990 RepID=UPI0039E7B5E1